MIGSGVQTVIKAPLSSRMAEAYGNLICELCLWAEREERQRVQHFYRLKCAVLHDLKMKNVWLTFNIRYTIMNTLQTIMKISSLVQD